MCGGHGGERSELRTVPCGDVFGGRVVELRELHCGQLCSLGGREHLRQLRGRDVRGLGGSNDLRDRADVLGGHLCVHCGDFDQ